MGTSKKDVLAPGGGRQHFNVPNDVAGRDFIQALRRYTAPGHNFRARGRGPRKAPGDRIVSFSRSLSIPKADAKSFAVYMGRKHGKTFTMDEQLDHNEHYAVWRMRRQKAANEKSALRLQELVSPVVHKNPHTINGWGGWGEVRPVSPTVKPTGVHPELLTSTPVGVEPPIKLDAERSERVQGDPNSSVVGPGSGTCLRRELRENPRSRTRRRCHRAYLR